MVYQNLLILSAFIFLYSLFAKRIKKSFLSGPFLAVLAGLVFGPLGLNLFQTRVRGEEYKLIAELALALAFSCFALAQITGGIGFTAKPFIKRL